MSTNKTIMRHFANYDNLDMKVACAKRFEPVLLEVDKLLKLNENKLIVAIDGKCASGKTTLGYYLQSEYDCNLFHMDDFFLREEQKTEERVNEIGGNVDYERFKTEVVDKLLKKQDVEYRKYSCKDQRINEFADVIKHKRLNIIEGSYSQHPILEISMILRFLWILMMRHKLKISESVMVKKD